MKLEPTSDDLPQVRPNLTRTAFSALKWNYAGTGVRMGANFAIGIVLASLLGPKPYGQVAIAALVIGFGNLVADIGLGSALIQKEEIGDEDVRFVFTVQVLFAALLVSALWPLTPWIVAFFHQPETVPIVRAMFPMFIFQAFGRTASSLLGRKLQQKRIQTAQLVSYLAGYVCLGIPLAIAGVGAWSLVAAQLVQSLLNAAILYAATLHPIKPLLWPRNTNLMRFGGKVVGANIFNWWISNADNLTVGRACGVAELGLYSRSFTLVNLPVNALISNLQAILFPAYSRAQSRSPLIRQTYLASLAIVAMVMLPLFAVIAVIPHAVIGGIYGRRWMAAAPVVVPLALAMPLDSMMSLAGPVLWGVGKVERELWVQMATAVGMTGMMFAMSQISFVAIGWGVLVIYLLRASLLTRAVIRTLEIRWIEVGRALCAPSVVALASALIVGGADRSWFARFAMGPRLLLDGVLAAVSYGLLLVASFPFWTKETQLSLEQVMPSSRALWATFAVLSKTVSRFV